MAEWGEGEKREQGEGERRGQGWKDWVIGCGSEDGAEMDGCGGDVRE